MSGMPSAMAAGDLGQGRAQLQFDDNLLLPLLYGERDQHLDRIERQLGVSLVTRGNRLAISARLRLSKRPISRCRSSTTPKKRAGSRPAGSRGGDPVRRGRAPRQEV